MKNISLSIIIFITLYSCTDEETENYSIGEDYVGTTTQVYAIDSLTVLASTFQLDSLIVSNPTRLLIGQYNDPVFGKTKSKCYTQLDNSLYDFEDEAVYDSIELVLKYDRYSYNDTIPIQQFKVYKVLENIEPFEGNYFNTSSLDYDIDPIAIKNFYGFPKKNDSLNIKINDDFGLTLFNNLKDNEINNNEEFLEEYKGILIDANDNNTSVLGFTNLSYIRLHYSIDDGIEPILKYHDITFNSINTFNQISSDKTGTPFEVLENQESQISSLETDNSCFMQSGTGILTKIDIPYLKNLYDIPGAGTVVDAKLKLSIKENSNLENRFTRDSLELFVINENSEVLFTLTHDGITPVIGNIYSEDLEFGSVNYVFDISPFIDIRFDETYEEYFLAIYPQEFNNSIDRYIINDSNVDDNLKMNIELIYAVYD